MQLPIFPLNLVILPGEPVPLHIFEARYQKLIADIAPDTPEQPYRPFGIQYSRRQQMNEIGCTVVVQEILHRYPDGRIDLMARGHRRYRLFETHAQSENDYLMGSVEWLDDVVDEEVPTELSQQVLKNYRRFLSIVDKEDETLPALEDVPLSFTLAYRINLETAPRLELLDTESEVERLELLLTYLEHAIPKLQQTREFRRRVRSNGYFA